MRARAVLVVALAVAAASPAAAQIGARAVPWAAQPAPPAVSESVAWPADLSRPRPAPRDLRGLCADPRLHGNLPDPVEGPGHCGIPLPVEVTHIGEVALEPPILVNCRTARAMADWVERGPAAAAPALLGARLKAIRIGGSYTCRTRNNLGGRLSEHAAGNAVDLSAFRLSDGRQVWLARDWRRGPEGDFLLQAWRAACGPFGTVLGPDHDAVHADHFHLDTASRIEGPNCR